MSKRTQYRDHRLPSSSFLFENSMLQVRDLRDYRYSDGLKLVIKSEIRGKIWYELAIRVVPKYSLPVL